MKKIFTQFASICLLAAFATGINLRAEEKKTEEKKIERKADAVMGMPMRGKLTAVDTKNKTVSVAGKEKDRVFQVTSQTKIMKEGKPATLEDAKVGDEVGGYAVKAGEDKLELRSLRIGPKPEPLKREKKDDEKKKKE